MIEEEKKYLLYKINRLIYDKREKLLRNLPKTQEIDSVGVQYYTHQN